MAAVTQQPVSPQWKPHLLMSWLSIFNHIGRLSDDSLKAGGEDSENIIYSAKLNYEAVGSKLPAGLEFYPRVSLRLLTHLLSKYSEEIKTLPSCTYTAHLIFWMVWGAALRGLTTGTRWPCNACMPLLYCLYGNVIDTDCLKSRTTSEQHQSGQRLLIISWWAAAHVLPTDGGCRRLPLLMTMISILKEVAEQVYRSTTEPSRKKK